MGLKSSDRHGSMPKRVLSSFNSATLPWCLLIPYRGSMNRKQTQSMRLSPTHPMVSSSIPTKNNRSSDPGAAGFGEFRRHSMARNAAHYHASLFSGRLILLR